jgi:cytochrome c peroxidase
VILAGALLLVQSEWSAEGGLPSAEWSTAELARILAHEKRAPAPLDATNAHLVHPAAAKLGQALFFEPRLSSNQQVSCATCHIPEQFFADGKRLAEGLAKGTRNTPTILNAAYQRWFFWDGRSDSLWSQALQPIENPLEMGSNRAAVLRLIQSDATLSQLYREAFESAPDTSDECFARLGKAIHAYEHQLVGGPSAFDRYARALRESDLSAQSQYPADARRGLKLFIGEANCRLCHSGPLFSDGEFHNLGLPRSRTGAKEDAGRYEALEKLAQNPFRAGGTFSDAPQGERAQEVEHTPRTGEVWGAFRTPSLRNVTRTAPYMHRGQFRELRDVIFFYSELEGAEPSGHHGERVLKNLNLSVAQMDDLLSFLDTLEEELPPATLRQPLAR